MQKKKIIEKTEIWATDDSEGDIFLRRIKLQGTILKKMIAEVDPDCQTESVSESDDSQTGTMSSTEKPETDSFPIECSNDHENK